MGRGKIVRIRKAILPLLLNLFRLDAWKKKRQISGQPDKARKTGGGREEGDEVDEGEDESFVVLMLNELENTIELLWLWKLLWGHRKLAPVWELARWQKRGFVWRGLLHRPAATEILTAVSWLDLSHGAELGGYSWTWTREVFGWIFARPFVDPCSPLDHLTCWSVYQKTFPTPSSWAKALYMLRSVLSLRPATCGLLFHKQGGQTKMRHSG